MSLTIRHTKEKAVTATCLVAAVLVVSALFLIIAQVFINGLPSLSWYFVSTPENATPGMGQGIANAIVGTIMISLCATIVAAPFGIGTAVYMKRYAPVNRITRTFRFLLEVLSGTPSIVVGIFGFLVFSWYLLPYTGGWSLIAGSLALAILIMPVIERAVEEAIDTVAYEMEEGSYALGATKWQTIRDITIPAAFTGILTSLTLGFGRAAEESAVVILTAGYTQYMPELAIKANEKLAGGVKIYPIQDQVATLPYAVYHAFQNSNVVKPSAGFAAAFVLIVIVFSINITGKALLRSGMGGGGTSLIGVLKVRYPFLFEDISLPRRKKKGTMDLPAGKEGQDQTGRDEREQSDKPSPSITRRIMMLLRRDGSSGKLKAGSSDGVEETGATIPQFTLRSVLRILLPFLIPAALLLTLAALATFLPLHARPGPVSPSIAGLIGAVLAVVIVVAGLAFGLLLARKSGAFREKTRRTGYTVVAAGSCLLLIAGIVCAATAPAIFSTGNQTIPSGNLTADSGSSDRLAKLAALAKQSGEEEGGSSSAVVQGYSPPAGTSGQQAGTGATGSAAPAVPAKDALSIGEYYSWGDAQHSSRATVYDYQVLPFYFWWWIDYNRFVQQIPAVGNSYLVIFIRIENTGTKSSVIPSADRFNVTSMGTSYGRLPYLNRSVISTWQSGQLENHDLWERYYQWIREIGQDKRDYAYLTGENLFRAANESLLDTCSDIVVLGDTTTINARNCTGWFLKPGRSQAVDGYLIFEVPDEVTENLEYTYVDVAFNSLSRARWRVG